MFNFVVCSLKHQRNCCQKHQLMTTHRWWRWWLSHRWWWRRLSHRWWRWWLTKSCHLRTQRWNHGEFHTVVYFAVLNYRVYAIDSDNACVCLFPQLKLGVQQITVWMWIVMNIKAFFADPSRLQMCRILCSRLETAFEVMLGRLRIWCQIHK